MLKLHWDYRPNQPFKFQRVKQRRPNLWSDWFYVGIGSSVFIVEIQREVDA